ncbi:hypothetical protein I4U23_007136 [Adineta vaga]|nr:hypothetical protein I4U23_007136 [Adineta vaga]
MAEQNIENNYLSMDNSDFLFSICSIQASLPSAEIRSPGHYDFDNADAFREINVTDYNMISDSSQSFNDLLECLRDTESFSITNPLFGCFNDDGNSFNSTESNDMTKLIQSSEECSVMIKTSNSVLPVLRSHVEKSAKGPSDQSILLSQSVAVTDSTRNQLQLHFPLETTYRARYKSDYFPQNGNVRRPRYVADDHGNHFVTLKIPIGYSRDLKNKYIRVALLTIATDDHKHYYSPYKFQTNHDDIKVPDQNPIYLPVQISEGCDSMKLLLVLIKSKLDQLYDAQPLKPFSDTVGSIQNIISDEKLPSKDLINKHQLDKSHIAFTLCTKLPDGSFDIHSETTIISSVITEIPTKSSAVSNTKSIPATTISVKTISCPNCQHCFDPNNISATEKGTKRKTSNQSSRIVTKAKTNNQTNKKKKST